MSKALTRAQADLNALKAEIEAWLATQPPEAVAAARAAALQSTAPKPVRKPAIKRTRVQLLEAATAPVVATEDVDTSWLDLLSPAPVVAPAPHYVDATDLIRIELEPPHILDFPEPQPVPARRTLRQAFRDGYNSYGN